MTMQRQTLGLTAAFISATVSTFRIKREWRRVSGATLLLTEYFCVLSVQTGAVQLYRGICHLSQNDPYVLFVVCLTYLTEGVHAWINSSS